MWCLRCEMPLPCASHDRAALLVLARGHTNLRAELQVLMNKFGVRVVENRRRDGTLVPRRTRLAETTG